MRNRRPEGEGKVRPTDVTLSSNYNKGGNRGQGVTTKIHCINDHSKDLRSEPEEETWHVCSLWEGPLRRKEILAMLDRRFKQ